MAKLSERDRERLSLFVDEMVAQRVKSGWSQADLAQEAAYSKSLIAQVEIYERAADQLGRLAEVADLRNVTVQVIPRIFGANPGLQGTFYVAEFKGQPSIVFTEDILGGRISDDPAAVAEVTLIWRYLTSIALPAGASLELIQEKQQRWTAQAARGARALTAVPTAEDASK